MLSEGAMLLVTPVIAVALAMGLAFWMGRLQSRVGLWALAVIWLVFTLAMILGVNTINGWDRVLYMLGLIIVSCPAALGALIGASLGWRRKEKTLHV
ncbi:hypothetical protein [Yoonia sp.]|uniref:hypothetical protein n=1 Tax=Yoonia sp. TaxID=2212373 RepID=UPI00391D810F